MWVFLVGDGTYKYTYDKIGNLVEKAGNGGQVSYTYNALNLLEKWTDGENTETYTYNAAGLLSTVNTNTSTTSLTWDILYGEGVVISAAENGTVTDYTYGLERISASTGKARTEYVYDGRGSVIGEVTKAGFFSGTKVTTKSYTPFGEQIGEKTSGFGWNGEYYNANTGMVYLRARFYEPEMNRFSQKDMLRGNITTPQTLNRYAYCGNDPVNFIDPSGMIANWLKVAAGAVAGAVTGAVVGAVTGGVVGAVVGGIAGGIAGGVAASAATKASAPPASNPPSSSAQTQTKKQEPTPTPTPTPHPQPTPTPSYTPDNPEKDGKYDKTPSTEKPSVWSKIKQACEVVLTSKPAQTVLNIYLGYESFENGVMAALIRNYGQTGVNLIGAVESLVTGRTTYANRLQSSLNAEVRSYEDAAYNDIMYSAGLVAGDIGEIAIDLLIAFFSGGASAGLKAAGVAGKGGEVLAVATETVSVAGVVVEGAGILDALKQSFNLGNDLDDLISQIKGNGNINNLGDADIKDLDRLPQNVIDENGGEEFTSELKQNTGKSKADLYWDKDGNIYSVPKNGGPPQWVGWLPRE